MNDDEIALRIEAFDAANGGGVSWYKDKALLASLPIKGSAIPTVTIHETMGGAAWKSDRVGDLGRGRVRLPAGV